ncbi:hypothetical protein ALC56_03726, partial [Trachymyrmex septentrionalis]
QRKKRRSERGRGEGGEKRRHDDRAINNTGRKKAIACNILLKSTNARARGRTTPSRDWPAG